MPPPIPKHGATQAAPDQQGRKLIPDNETVNFTLVSAEYESFDSETHGHFDKANFIFRCDTGEHAGGSAFFDLTWGDDAERAEETSSRLQRLADNARTDDGEIGEAGFVWSDEVGGNTDAEIWQNFIGQFGRKDKSKLRIKARVAQVTSFKINGAWGRGKEGGQNLYARDADKFEARMKGASWVKELSKSTKCVIVAGSIEPPDGPAEVAFGAPAEQEAPKAGPPKKPGGPPSHGKQAPAPETKPTAAASGGGAFDVDEDDLPF